MIININLSWIKKLSWKRHISILKSLNEGLTKNNTYELDLFDFGRHL